MLVIRGELLKRYPTAVIYAQAAEWAAPAGRRDRPREGARARRAHRGRGGRPAAHEAAHAALRGEGRARHLLLRLRPDGAGRARRDRRTARRSGRLVLRHQGAPGRAALRLRRDLGRPGRASTTTSAGTDVPRSGEFIRPVGGSAARHPGQLAGRAGGEGAAAPRGLQVRWDGGVSSAELAYVMYQAPVMVAVHAAEMLPGS